MSDSAWPASLSLATFFILATKVCATEVMVFTAPGLPAMARLELASEVHVLAPIDPLLEQLRFPYPGSESAAVEQARAQLNSPAGREVLDGIKARANAAGMAWLTGIDYLPAVLVSPGYVVYGVFDVAAAIERVESYVAGH